MNKKPKTIVELFEEFAHKFEMSDLDNPELATLFDYLHEKMETNGGRYVDIPNKKIAKIIEKHMGYTFEDDNYVKG